MTICVPTQQVPGSETTENEDGSTTTQTVLYVNVKLKTRYDMITEYNFDSDQIELVEEMMRMFGSTSGVTPQSALTQEEVDAILQDITDPTQRTVVSYAPTKVGYPTVSSTGTQAIIMTAVPLPTIHGKPPVLISATVEQIRQLRRQKVLTVQVIR